jgi:hypothetical protein
MLTYDEQAAVCTTAVCMVYSVVGRVKVKPGRGGVSVNVDKV